MAIQAIVFTLGSVLLATLMLQPAAKKALQFSGKKRGEYLATKYGTKMNYAYTAWVLLFVADLMITAVCLLLPQAQDTIYIAGILHSILELFTTLLFIVVYEFISASEILVRIAVPDKKNLSTAKDYSSGRNSLCLQDQANNSSVSTLHTSVGTEEGKETKGKDDEDVRGEKLFEMIDEMDYDD
jgi:hypothetical protein